MKKKRLKNIGFSIVFVVLVSVLFMVFGKEIMDMIYIVISIALLVCASVVILIIDLIISMFSSLFD